MPGTARARAVGFNHVALEVGDIEEALSFYARIFDFELRGKSEDMAFIDLGDQLEKVAASREMKIATLGWWSRQVRRPPSAGRSGPNFCPGLSSIFTTLGAIASRSSATRTFSSPRRRTYYVAWV